ncbi:hypothetical protein GCM10023238_07620 [Streptomyces heliomycini]
MVLVLVADGPAVAVPLRFTTGMFLAGVYPTGMKLMASWSGSAGRGRTMGVLIAALTLGSTLPHLIAGLGSLPWRGVLLAAAAAGLAGLRRRPGPRPARPPHGVVAPAATPGTRWPCSPNAGRAWPTSATSGTCGSSTPCGPGSRPSCWRPPPREDSRARWRSRCSSPWDSAERPAASSAAGARTASGRSPAALTALLLSGLCCLLSPLLFHAPPPLLFAFCALWGAAVIADSGVFSTSLSEVADHRYIGTALTGQTAIGFALTVVSIQLTPLLAEAVGWEYAFLLLAPGPLAGALAMRAFGKGAPSARSPRGAS